MGAVEIIQDITKDLTTVTVRDKFSTEAIMDSITDYYSGNVTSLLLLDCREADLKKEKYGDRLLLINYPKRRKSSQYFNCWERQLFWFSKINL